MTKIFQRFIARHSKPVRTEAAETIETSADSETTRRSLRVLRANARYRKLFAARTASVFGNQFTSLALAFGILDLPGHKNAATLGLVFAAASAGTVIFLLVGGGLGRPHTP